MIDALDDERSIFDPVNTQLRARVASGVSVTAALQGLRVVLQMGSVVVLSRLLLPSDFGVVAMTSPVLGFMMIFQDLGLSQAAVQRRILTQRQASTLYWLNVVFAAVTCIAALAISPVVGWFYGDPRVFHLLAAYAPLFFLSGCYAQHSALLTRQMRFSQLAIVEGAAGTIGFIASLVAAWFLRSYWAVFVLSLTTTLATGAGMMLATRWLPSRPRRDPDGRDMLHFGAGVTGANIFNFLSRNLDNILIGKVWGSVALGLYDRAYKLLLFPLRQVNNPIQRVMEPALAGLVDEPRRYRHAYMRVVRMMALFTTPAILGTMVCADWFVDLVLGSRWAEVVPIFRALALAGLLEIFGSTLGWLMITQRRSSDLATWALVNTTVCIISFVAGLPWGPLGVAIAYSTSEVLIRTPAACWFVGRKGPVSRSDLFWLIAPFAMALAAAAGVLLVFRGFWSGPTLVALGIGYALAYATTWAILALFGDVRAALFEVVGFARQLIGGGLTRLRKRTA